MIDFDWVSWAFCLLQNLLFKSMSMVADLLPSTPEQYKLASLFAAFDAAVPLVGSAVLNDVIQCFLWWLGVVALLKFWKLLPFT